MCNFIQDCSNGQDERLCGYNCTFGNTTAHENCLWENQYKEGDVLAWSEMDGTRNNSYAPPVDHTTLTPQGFSMVLAPVDVLLQANEETTAVLQSRTLHNAASTCRMSFWYIMFGKASNDSSSRNVGVLNVKYKTDDVSTNMLYLSGNYGDEWKFDIAYLGRIRPEFQLLFVGNRNLDVEGYIAVDDIRLEYCFLPTPIDDPADCMKFLCINGACIAFEDQCDFTDDCGDSSDEEGCTTYAGRCNFEDGSICDWTQDEGDHWKLGSPSMEDLIPQRDHTLNTVSGSYIHIDSSKFQTNATTATLYSPLVTWNALVKEGPCLLRMFYYVDGPAVKKLTISTRDSYGGPITEHFAAVGAVGPYWEKSEIYISPDSFFEKQVQYIIMGEVLDYAGGERSVIALDDLSFNGACDQSLSTLPTAQTEFTSPRSACPEYECGSGECIPFDLVCDFISDCSDDSDENTCAECNFDDNMCGWGRQQHWWTVLDT